MTNILQVPGDVTVNTGVMVSGWQYNHEIRTTMADIKPS